MQNGIGGCTIREAKQRLTYAEIETWRLYINKRGTLNHGLRLEIRTAEIMAMIANLANKCKPNGSSYKMADFVLHVDGAVARRDDDDDGELTIEDVLRALGRST